MQMAGCLLLPEEPGFVPGGMLDVKHAHNALSLLAVIDTMTSGRQATNVFSEIRAITPNAGVSDNYLEAAHSRFTKCSAASKL